MKEDIRLSDSLGHVDKARKKEGNMETGHGSSLPSSFFVLPTALTGRKR